MEISREEIHSEIIEELKKFTCSESEAEDFHEWIEENNWMNYDGIDTWINPKTGKVVETKTLFKIYEDANKCDQ